MDILYNSFVYYTLFNVTYYTLSLVTFLCDYNTIYEPRNKIIIDEIELNEYNQTSPIYSPYTLFKSQQTNHNEIMQTYNKIITTVTMNTFVYSIPFIIMGGYYDTLFMHIPFTITKFICDIFITLVCIDPLFYLSHRILHINILYKLFHKKHHEITKPVGMSALYTSVTEFYVGNILPIFLPLLLINAHPLTVKIWLIIILINTIIFAHSGYKQLADFHDKHHKCFTKNYGTDMFVDKLLGTYI